MGYVNAQRELGTKSFQFPLVFAQRCDVNPLLTSFQDIKDHGSDKNLLWMSLHKEWDIRCSLHPLGESLLKRKTKVEE